MDDHITRQYSGTRARLRPIFDAIVERMAGACPGCRVVSKRDSVDLVRTRKFAAIFPEGDEVIVALVLDGVAPTGRLERVESFGSPVTHRMRLRQVTEVDAELLQRMSEAWERSQYEPHGA